MSFAFKNFGRAETPLGPQSLVALNDPRSVAAEAYRTLRANVQFSSPDKPVHTLLITSPRPGEDKSVTVANLAITFAQMGSRVILIDADLRRPAIHTLFGLPNGQGLSTVLGQAGSNWLPGKTRPVGESLPLSSTVLPGLRILTAGPLPANPAELLSSGLLPELLNRLREEADYILLDAPPVLAVSDATILASQLDGTILVLKSGKTSRDDAREAKEQLHRVRANLLGSVLGNARQAASRYSY